MRIRRAVPEDAALLARLNPYVHSLHVESRPDIFQETPDVERLTARFAERLRQDTARIFVAELQEGELPDGEAAGYAGATVHHRPADVLLNADSFIALDQIVVVPAAKRLGVAGALLEAVREAGRQEGCRRMVTDVWDFNEGARSFYEAVGFRPMKRLLEQPL
ncbi:GNAT family N-acetyltransferase [Nonomuraea rhodomycinica]|uniref:GNAT family N-acetyltransferase n=1 Tax=Nonomuraea rhodomycinica TaxID=1712872 RepID=A0A7Y6IWX0_9ACTN|nr:GNAT family N-acetyltransferase [Nonomuraea rhodomycinica]NUW45896.1 GNAT family N-acetyltransferase [Nonomuraea rhodomycinica]